MYKEDLYKEDIAYLMYIYIYIYIYKEDLALNNL